MAAVITGGAISGTATVSAVILRENLAARQAAVGREAELRGLARIAGLRFHQAEAFLKVSAENRRLFHGISRLPTADSLAPYVQPLAAHLDAMSWGCVRTAVGALIGSESLREEEAMRTLRDGEVQDFQEAADLCRNARLILEAFAEGLIGPHRARVRAT